jgi:hypothetical protein
MLGHRRGHTQEQAVRLQLDEEQPLHLSEGIKELFTASRIQNARLEMEDCSSRIVLSPD